MRRHHRVQAPGAHRRKQRAAFDELVTRERVEPAFRCAAAAVARAANALQERRDAAGRRDLAHELHGTDVDAELERCRGDQRAEVAGAQPGLHAQPALLGEAAVMRGHRVVAEPLREQMRHAFGHAARVDEHDGGLVPTHVSGDAVQHVGHLLARRDRPELFVGQLDGDVKVALMPDVDDGASRLGAHEQPRDHIDGSLRRGETDAHRRRCAEARDPLQRQRQVRATLVACHRVDLVDDDGAH